MAVESLIPDLAALLGVDPTTALLITGVVVSVSNLVGRLIPDDEVGALGAIRKAAKIIGLYAPNTISKGVSVNDIAVSVAKHEAEEFIEEVTPAPIKAFPGLDSVDNIIQQTEHRLRSGEGR
jgi:hypothetical protein